MGNDGIIVSESAPDVNDKVTWYKPSTKEYFELIEGIWVLQATDVVFPTIEVVGLIEGGSLEITERVECGGEVGIDTEVAVTGATLKFSKGILYEVEVS